MSGERQIKMNCGKCGVDYSMPEELYLAARKSEKISFFCPYGHERVFVAGPSREDKLRQRAERAEQNGEYYRQRANSAERSASAYKGQVTRLKNRAKAGACPCCNRTFQNLQRHMTTQHPDFGLEAIEGGKTA